MIGLGLTGVLLGLFMLFLTGTATQIIVALSGFAIILLAAIFIVEGLCIDAEGWPRWAVLGIGVLGLLLGVLSVAVPALLVVSTGILTGIFLIVYGIGELAIGVTAVFAETLVRMLFVMLGLFSLVVGIFLVLNPVIGIDIFVWLFGFYLLVLGLMRVAHGLSEREAEQKVAGTRL
jgi:uncharacterized membrane protein HdeD (DUF308 family)